MNPIRSLLFVPGDSERKIAKAQQCGADALILDLEDSVVPERKSVARALSRELLARDAGGPRLFVRINALSSSEAMADLAAVVGGTLFGIMLPKCQSARDLSRLDDMLGVLETREGLELGRIAILPIVTETGRAMLGFSSYAETTSPRLFGMTWGGEDLAADLGARSNRDDTGSYSLPYQLARSFCLFAAASAGVAPIDAVFTDLRDGPGLRREASAAARGGFTGKMAIHPAQVEPINEAFTPSLNDIEHARRVVAAFARADIAGVATLDGQMLDLPHYRIARRVLGHSSEPQGMQHTQCSTAHA